MKRITAMILSVCILATILVSCDLFSDKARLTVMMYVVGSDLESENGCASADIREILNSSLDLKRVNYLIYTGGAESWKTEIPGDTNSVYLVTEKNGEKELTRVSQTEARADMGEPGQLTSFLNFAYQYYPAKEFGLICWDHGGGPNRGFGYDENYDDFLELDEISAALEASPFNGENKLSWIGFDACLMGSVEVGNALKNYTDYLIASEETEPGSGWDYGFLSDVGSYRGAETFAKACIDRFHQSTPESILDLLGSGLNSGPDILYPSTLSVVDLRMIEPLNRALDALFGAMDASQQSSSTLSLVYQRQSLYSFGSAVSAEGGTEPDLVDIGELAETSRSNYPAEAEGVIRALDDYVVYQQSNLEQPTGATIYYPFSGLYTFYYMGGCESYIKNAVCENYANYIKGFTDRCFRGVTHTDNNVEQSVSALNNADVGENMISVNLTAGQKETFARAYVNVLKKYDSEKKSWNNDYSPILLNYQLTPDQDGNLAFNADIPVPVQMSGENKTFLPMKQISSSPDRSTYRSLGSLLISGPEVLPYTVWETVNMITAYSDVSDDLRIIGIHYSDSGRRDMGKNTIDPDDWNYFSTFLETKMLKANADGTVPPYSDWEIRDNYLMEFFPFDGHLNLKMLPLSQCGYGEYYFQVVIEDIYGGIQSSRLFPFTEGEKYESVTEGTEHGRLTYRLFPDHAVLEKYEGTDSTLVIPETFRNIPVNAILEHAFMRVNGVEELVITNPDTWLGSELLASSSIKKVTLPEGMRSIGEKAFLGCSLEEINIPSTVETIGRHAFMRCASLKELAIPASVKEIDIGAFSGTIPENGITVSGDNPNYKIEKGFLLSKDGKIAYTTFQESESIVVPEGVTELASWSCIGAPVKRGGENKSYWVKSVQLPESLRIIRSDAFRNCLISELVIPDGVQYIGNNAFANYEVEDTDDHPTVRIGKGLSRIGKEVFGYNQPDTVEVSEDNPYYSSVNGRLMNKAGDAEISLARVRNNDAARENEYKTLEMLRSIIDLSSYEPKGFSNEYTYDGNTYYRELENSQVSTVLDNTVNLDGAVISLPCKISDLTEAGFAFFNPNDRDVTLEADGSYSVRMENSMGQLLTASCRNNTDSDIPISQAKVWSITVPNENGVGFLAGGVSSAMDLRRAVDKIGPPKGVRVEYQKDEAITLITLTYSAHVTRGSENITVFLELKYAFDAGSGQLSAYENVIYT